MKYLTDFVKSEPMSVAPHWGAWIEIVAQMVENGATVSHPTGVRGLKCRVRGRCLMHHEPSHPTGVRGLKYAELGDAPPGGQVAPHWGAWIEIRWDARTPCASSVAPHWGAWIEIVRG